MTERPIQNVLSRLQNAKQSGSGWTACCPAHDDKNPSLSISEGSDGRVLLKCHAGCRNEDVCRALDVDQKDLFPQVTSTQPPKNPGNGRLRRRRQPKAYESAGDAVTELERKHGKVSQIWTYDNAHGEPVGKVVRWDKADGKDIRPLAKENGKWVIGGMPEPRPLYSLPELAHADRVYITEGEKAADAARSIGLCATTSAQGSQSPGKTDWSPLAGKEVVILPDNDEAGRKYADDVAEILHGLSPVPTVKIVDLPGLPEKGDIHDFLESRDAAVSKDILTQVEQLVDLAEVWEPENANNDALRFKPFPVDAMPEPVRGFIVHGAKAIQCDACYLALPLLSAFGAAIGTSRALQLKPTWKVLPIIWTAIVGESGTSKTPAHQLVMQFVEEIQGKALRQHEQDLTKHETYIIHYEKKLADWKRPKKKDDKGYTDDPPEKPTPPAAKRYFVNDTTVEALAIILKDNPRGLLLTRDELNGWIGSFDRYSAGKGGADAAHWLSMFNGGSITVDRKTGDRKTTYVPQAAVAVTGGIQPSIFHRALGSEHRESGLLARFLLAFPPRKPKRWTEDTVSQDQRDQMADVYRRLYSLEPDTGDDDDPTPHLVGMTPGARQRWADYYESHNEEQCEKSGEHAAAWSKLEEYAARLALIAHFIRWAAEDKQLQHPDILDEQSIEAGIELVSYFKNEVKRLYARMSESEEDHDRRQLVEWIQGKGGSVTVREAQQGNRQFKTAEDAKHALQELADEGYGEWESVPPGAKGGRASQAFRLKPRSPVYTTPSDPEENDGSVDVDGSVVVDEGVLI